MKLCVGLFKGILWVDTSTQYIQYQKWILPSNCSGKHLFLLLSFL